MILSINGKNITRERILRKNIAGYMNQIVEKETKTAKDVPGVKPLKTTALKIRKRESKEVAKLDETSRENYEYFRKYCHPKFIDRHLFNGSEDTEKFRQEMARDTKKLLEENKHYNYIYIQKGILEEWFSEFYENHLPGKNIGVKKLC